MSDERVQASGPAPKTLTDDELARMAEITTADIARSKADAQRKEPKLAALLRARNVK